MDGFPLRSMTGRDHGGQPHFEGPGNARQVSDNVHERLIMPKTMRLYLMSSPVAYHVRTWPSDGLVLRLGYWKQEETNNITHGVRFLPRNGPFGAEQPTRREAHHSSDLEEDSYGTNIDRIWNMYLVDWYIIFTTTMGLVLLVVAAYAWAMGLIFQPFRLTSMLLGTLQRAIAFSLLPALAYGLFHQTFLAADVYTRTMIPIHSVYLVVARIFDFSEAENGHYSVHIHAKSFYASSGIMSIYCLSNWVLRPHSSIRTCRPVYGLVDFVSLVYRSDILLCPEFWLQDSADTEEDMNAQVTLANRLYQYGIYHGIDGRRHVGIGVEYAPPARLLDDENILCLDWSVNLARAAISSGIYSDASLVSAENFITNEPQRRSSL